MDEFKRINRELVCKGKVIDFYRDTMHVPNGNTVYWDLIDHKGAAAVVAVCDDGRLLMVRQYRGPLDGDTLELPAGGLNSREEPTLEAAVRELEEETGCKCEHIEFLMSMYASPAFSNERVDIYVATDLSAGEQHPDEDEFLNVEAYTIAELKQMIWDGRIQDSKTICGILGYAAKYNKE